MQKVLITLLFTVSMASGLWAQLTPYQAFLPLYQEGVELFDKAKYGAAQKKLDAFLAYEEDLRAKEENDLHANARYLQAICAYELERENTEELLEEFLREFPENTKASLAQYYLGKYWFNRKKYSKAIAPFQAAVQSSNLTKDIFDEVVYLLGYAFFDVKNYDQAVRFFDMAAAKPNPYQEDARYYKAIIQYKEKKLRRSLRRF